MARTLGAIGAGIGWMLTLAPGAVSAQREGLADRVAEILATPGFEMGHWGLLVVDRGTGEVVFEHEADRLFIPGEVAQLFPAAAALEALGAEHRFQTPVLRRGEVGPDGSLHGDLILMAVGDPSLGGRTSPKDGSLLYRDVDHTRAGLSRGAALVEADPLAGLDHLAREVKAAGISAVTGEVIVDDRLFEGTPTGGAVPSRVVPISVNDNLIDVVVTPAAEPGKPAEVRTIPSSSYYSAEALVETVAEGQPPRLEVRREGPRRFSIRGQLPVGQPPVVLASEVEQPADFARALLIEQLRARGVRVDASPLAGNPASLLPAPAEVAALPKVAQYTSPPLREYVRVLLKVGHHQHAAALPLLLAASKGRRTQAEGLRILGEVLAGLGLPTQGICLADGAGIDRADLVSPRAVVALLRAMDGRPGAPAFEAALPVIGREGTALDVVAADSPARGHARSASGSAFTTDATTGRSLLLTKSLAGYLETASGRDLAFAFFVNHVPASPSTTDRAVTDLYAARLLGKLCELFYSDQPSPEGSPSSSPPSSLEEQGVRLGESLDREHHLGSD
ncbi:D-alanyl-D-alanine carboxypeptidase/D-alanyl-D-alanine endopeptidase [Tautonia sociabilis]|uniref:D-alanyl-D-alanine carboxypeptidase/D-alanyl-D-alanine-endopeptidase n=1 Tax=Tautonia sociabilis TaxID=2080755 RepID=A0A432MS20_9BACT|nr:D-alanyl-D-alanine carboxypeptidase/D-alanyl-D-alanine-endopeptidase [Tautonia sociabilis]RUL89755.1 D-alanyl-D-alanine carboxypeptidase/D-alanyl-D-alanine-endopeptidase [Tautonia sociabilis]